MDAKPNAALIMSVLVIVGAVGVVLYPVIAPNSLPSHGSEDISRMKQLGVGALIYAEDSSNCLPMAANWKDATFPYIKAEYVYQCVELKNGVNAYGHVFERSASGLNVMKVAEPRKQVIFFDGTNIIKNAVGNHRMDMDYDRGGGTAWVTFVDAHVKKVTSRWLDD